MFYAHCNNVKQRSFQCFEFSFFLSQYQVAHPWKFMILSASKSYYVFLFGTMSSKSKKTWCWGSNMWKSSSSSCLPQPGTLISWLIDWLIVVVVWSDKEKEKAWQSLRAHKLCARKLCQAFSYVFLLCHNTQSTCDIETIEVVGWIVV